MKLERDRHYYDRKDRIWRVAYTLNGPHGSFSDKGNFIHGSENNCDLIRPVFEPGQKWRDERFCDYVLREYNNGAWVIEHGRLSEKWLLKNCDLVKDEPEYIDVQQSVINKMTKELIAKDAEIARLQNGVTIYENMIEKMKATLEGAK